MGKGLGADQYCGARTCKVAHVTTIDLTLRYFLNLLRYLVMCGYTVFGVSNPGPQVPVLAANGIKHIAVAMTRQLSPLADLRSLWALYWEFRAQQFDIVHTHTPKGNLIGQWAALLACVPVRVMTVHGLYFTPKSSPLRRLVFSLVETASLLPAHCVFLVNQQDYATLENMRVCNMRKVRVLPGGIGIDVRRFDRSRLAPEEIKTVRQEFGLRDNDVVIGFVGRMVYEKGIMELLIALRMLVAVHDNVRLLLVGPIDIDKQDAVSPDVIEQLGIADYCILTGAMDDTVRAYAAMDIFALPSYREGMPLVTMEAQAMSLPVVTSDARGCIESIIDSETGLVVPLQSAPALAAALEKLVVNPELRSCYGRAGRRLAEARFDERLVNAETETLYQTLLAARR